MLNCVLTGGPVCFRKRLRIRNPFPASRKEIWRQKENCGLEKGSGQKSIPDGDVQAVGPSFQAGRALSRSEMVSPGSGVKGPIPGLFIFATFGNCGIFSNCGNFGSFGVFGKSEEGLAAWRPLPHYSNRVTPGTGMG